MTLLTYCWEFLAEPATVPDGVAQELLSLPTLLLTVDTAGSELARSPTPFPVHHRPPILIGCTVLITSSALAKACRAA
jgi:hypothetical protein